MSSWLGTSVLNLGEWFIKRMPFVRHIYNASKQISTAISPGVFPLNLSLFWWSLHYIYIYMTLSNHLILFQIKTHRLSKKSPL